MIRYFYFLSILFVTFGCKSTLPINKIQLSNQHLVDFLDSTQAAAAIIRDDTDHFFEKVTLTEMQIQMKANFPTDISRASAVQQYQDFLQTDVATFTNEEIANITAIFNKAYAACQQLHPSIFPPSIKLIKTPGKHYGASVYYTREDCIIIPQNVLDKFQETSFYNTMLHEIFHIYSRYNEDKRMALYQLIGFENIGDSKDLLMNTALAESVLHNPDGINFAYKIDLMTPDNKAISAIPIITANAEKFMASRPLFFNYLKFNLYEIQKKGEQWEVLTTTDGQSTLSLQELPDFNKQIKDNTNYIIHPDEIMADNFMLLLGTLAEAKRMDKFSKEGQKLLKDAQKILAN